VSPILRRLQAANPVNPANPASQRLAVARELAHFRQRFGMSQLSEVLQACGYHDDYSDDDATEGAGSVHSTPPHPQLGAALDELTAMHDALPAPAPAAAAVELPAAASTAISVGVPVNQGVHETATVVPAREEGGATQLSLCLSSPPASQPAAAEAFNVSPTIANLLADETNFHKANADLLEELEKTRAQLTVAQLSRKDKAQAYAELKIAFNRLECERLALIRELREKEKVLAQIGKVLLMAARVLSELLKKPFHEVPGIVARLQRVLMSAIPK